jgi:hypothetical protein
VANVYVTANLACLGVLVVAVGYAAHTAGSSWFEVAVATVLAFFVGGWVVERLAPGTRLLQWLGYDDRRRTPPSAP